MNEIERAIEYWEEFEREIDEMPHIEILEAQREPVRTALTVLRAEISRQENAPLTWNERINQMTVEEKVLFLSPMINCAKCKAKQTGVCPLNCRRPLMDFLNSPYTEGETK